MYVLVLYPDSADGLHHCYGLSMYTCTGDVINLQLGNQGLGMRYETTSYMYVVQFP